jgi:hypothetical protein
MHLLWLGRVPRQRKRIPKDPGLVTHAVISKSNVSFQKTAQICLADAAQRLAGNVT